MENKIQIEQAFFGNGPSGYQLLDITDKKYSSLVTKYCGAIGTPDGISEVSPFLFSVPVAGNVLMFCCQRGEPDTSGRPTLFFHTMIAKCIEAEQFNVDAFTLFDAGYFKNHIADSCLPITLTVPLEKKQSASPTFAWDGSPLAIVSTREEKNVLRSLLGKHMNEIAWSSFAFQPLPEFSLYAISKYVIMPQDRKCVSPTGELLSSGQSKDDVRIMKSSNASSSGKARINWLSWLILSMIINIMLICVVFSLFKRKNNFQLSDISTRQFTTQDIMRVLNNNKQLKEEIKEEFRDDVINDLKNKFSIENKIDNMDFILKNRYLIRLKQNIKKEQGENEIENFTKKSR